MKIGQLAGREMPRFTYDTPYTPANDFYALCQKNAPLALVFLSGCDDPFTNKFLSSYRDTFAQKNGFSIACVVYSTARQTAKRFPPQSLPFPVLCDGSGSLYGYFSLRHPGFFSRFSPALHQTIRQGRAQGLRHLPKDSFLPFLLILGADGAILADFQGKNLLDLPQSCEELSHLVHSCLPPSLLAVPPSPKQVHSPSATPASPPSAPVKKESFLASDDTTLLPDLGGLDGVDDEYFSLL